MAIRLLLSLASLCFYLLLDTPSCVARPARTKRHASLDDALNFIQEQRRRLGDERLYGDQYDGGYYWPQEDVEDGEDQGIDTDLLLEELLEGGEEEQPREPDSFDTAADGELETFKTPADMSELEGIMELSGDEQREAEVTQKVKKSIPYGLEGQHYGEMEYEPSPFMDEDEEPYLEQEEDEEEGEDNGLTTLSASEVQSILDDQSDQLAQEEAEEQSVSDDEVAELLSGGEIGDEDEEEEAEKEALFNNAAKEAEATPIMPATSLTRETIDVASLYGDSNDNGGDRSRPVSLKRKRSGENYLEEEEESEMDDDYLSQADLARKYIKLFLELEDDENTNLANALNLATMAQLDTTDKYVKSEADYIRKAIADEESIQKLRLALKGGLSADEEEDDDEVQEEPGLFRKRGYPTKTVMVEEEEEYDPEEEEEFWEELEKEAEEEEAAEKLAQEVAEEELAEALAEEEAEEEEEEEESLAEAELREYLAKKLKEYLAKAEESEAEGEGEGQWFDRPVQDDDEEIIDNGDMYLNPFWREILEQYKSGLISKRGDPYEEEEQEEELIEPYEEEDGLLETQADIPDLLPWQRELAAAIDEELAPEEDEMCPVVELVDDCLAAREMGLHLDEDALELCNRHQLCYTCGSVNGLTADLCDAEYLDDARLFCKLEEDERKCWDDAVEFLVLLRDQHPYTEAYDAPGVCEEECAAEWLYGVAGGS